jgi:outer membrane protein TolC
MQSRFYSPIPRWLLVGCILAICLVDAPGALAAQNEPANEAIKQLLKERLAIATTIYEQQMEAHKQGATSFERVRKAMANLLNAKLDLCETKVERLGVHEEMVKLAAQSVSNVEALSKASEVPQFELLNAKLELLTARIALERAKADK